MQRQLPPAVSFDDEQQEHARDGGSPINDDGSPDVGGRSDVFARVKRRKRKVGEAKFECGNTRVMEHVGSTGQGTARTSGRVFRKDFTSPVHLDMSDINIDGFFALENKVALVTGGRSVYTVCLPYA